MKILLADDHMLFREALIQLISTIEPQWKFTTVSNFNKAYETLKNEKSFDLILLDLRMPGMNSLEGLSKIITSHPNQKTAILSGVAEEHHIKEALRIGACGYFPKTLSIKILIQAIKLVLSGQKYIAMDQNGKKIMPSYKDDYSNIAPVTKKIISYKLTKRESEVLQYLAQGLSNKHIANDLNIQISTVKLHVRGICTKLDVQNRTQAAVAAHQYGLVSTDLKR